MSAAAPPVAAVPAAEPRPSPGRGRPAAALMLWLALLLVLMAAGVAAFAYQFAERPRRHGHAQHRDVGPVHPVLHVLRRPVRRRAHRGVRRTAVRGQGLQAHHAPRGPRGHRRGHPGGHVHPARPGPAGADPQHPALLQPDLADDLGHHDRDGLHDDVGARTSGSTPARTSRGAARGWPSGPGRRSGRWPARSGRRRSWPGSRFRRRSCSTRSRPGSSASRSAAGFWYSSIMAPMFIASALVSGMGLVILLALVLRRLGRLVFDNEPRGACSAACSGVFIARRGVPAPRRVPHRLLPRCTRGRGRRPDAHGARTCRCSCSRSWCGLVVPFVILAIRPLRNDPRWVALASGIAIVGIFVPPAEPRPQRPLRARTSSSRRDCRSGWRRTTPHTRSPCSHFYVPTIVEWLVVIGILAFGALVFTRRSRATCRCRSRRRTDGGAQPPRRPPKRHWMDPV